MVKRYIFIFLLALTTTAFGQSQRKNDTEVSGVNPRLEQLEDYLQQKGMKIVYDLAHIGGKNSKLRQTWCGIKTMKDKEVDSICSVINDLSKNAIESHMYEFHKNGTDTIDYVVMLNDKEEVEFDVKRTKSGDMSLCYCHTYWTERGKGTVADAIAERHWRINVHTMNTMRYGTRTVTPDFYLELRGDTLHSYLPYLGQARVSSTISPSIGLNFEEPVLSYKKSIPKSKKYMQIDIDVRTREDKYHYVMELYDTGKAIIRVRSQNSDPISFDGTLSMTTAQNVVKAGDEISGTVSDDMGPLTGATVCEIDAREHIIESAVTDNNGRFIMKVRNPEDRIRFSYVGMKTTKLAIDKKEYKIKLQPVRLTQQDILKKRQSGPSTLPIPQREISYKDLDQIMEERGMVKAEDLELEGDPVISNRNNPRGLISLTDEEQALVTSVNDLGFNLIRTISLLDPKSILLSPLGMTFALGQINNGAAGETRKQINQVLGCKDKETAKINNFCRKMLTEAPQLDKTTQLEITNEFISPKSFTPKPAFTQVVKDSYDTQFMESESEPLKFTLKNTIYFKGIWADKFRKMNTRDEVFRCESGIETTVPMMNQFHQFFYTENDLCQALCLPYSNGAYQMIILLPKEEKTVCNVAWSLTADSWKKMYAQMQRIDVDVKLPRFETESEENLAGTMTPLMPNAFRMNKADFSNLFDVKSCIDRIKQKGHIKVDETGAEASVITSLQGDLGSVKTVQPETVRFHANHPFLYFIREWSTGTIFFIGQYMGLY